MERQSVGNTNFISKTNYIDPFAEIAQVVKPHTKPDESMKKSPRSEKKTQGHRKMKKYLLNLDPFD